MVLGEGSTKTRFIFPLWSWQHCVPYNPEFYKHKGPDPQRKALQLKLNPAGTPLLHANSLCAHEFVGYRLSVPKLPSIWFFFETGSLITLGVTIQVRLVSQLSHREQSVFAFLGLYYKHQLPPQHALFWLHICLLWIPWNWGYRQLWAGNWTRVC